MNGITAALAAAIVVASGVVQANGETHSMDADAARKEQEAWGIAGDRKAVTRTIEIEMLDEMRFTPARIDARQGETVRLVARNRGKLMHELVLGTQKVLDEHAAMMARSPGMQHGELHMVHVAPRRRRRDPVDVQPARHLPVCVLRRRALPGRHARDDHGGRRQGVHAAQVNGALVVTAIEPAH